MAKKSTYPRFLEEKFWIFDPLFDLKPPENASFSGDFYKSGFSDDQKRNLPPVSGANDAKGGGGLPKEKNEMGNVWSQVLR